MTDYIRDAVLATTIYYDILDFPLTLFEIYKNLINPQRLSKKSRVIGDIGLGDILGSLERLEKSEIVGSKNGFYFLRGQENIYRQRIERDKISIGKWRKVLKYAWWFQAVPYLRAIFVGGSLAIGNTAKESDLDTFVIFKSGRLYLGRIILSVLSSLLGARRTRYQKIAPDKFCFNHYKTDDRLLIKNQSIFGAQTYGNLKPILGGRELFADFYGENIWINRYMYNFKPALDYLKHTVKESEFLTDIAKFFEKILDTPIGDLFEWLAKKYQQRRIKNNPATYEPGGRVIFNDGELEFHPRSFEKNLLNQYNRKIFVLGVSNIEEEDSGLVT